VCGTGRSHQADLLGTGCDRAPDAARVQREHAVADGVAVGQVRHQFFRAGHLRYPRGIDERGSLDMPHAGRHQGSGDREPVREGHQDRLVLEHGVVDGDTHRLHTTFLA
jgi:hypothetical protein